MQINSTFLLLAIVVFASCIILASADSAISCTSCGDECADACGTRHFRTCCFNYLRKRSSPPAMDAKPKLWVSKALLNKLIKLAQLEESDRMLIPQPLQNYNKFSESPPDDEGQGGQQSPAMLKQKLEMFL